MSILLTDEEIGIVLRRCDCSMVDTRHDMVEPDEHKEIAEAQLIHVVEYLIEHNESGNRFVLKITGLPWQELLIFIDDKNYVL